MTQIEIDTMHSIAYNMPKIVHQLKVMNTINVLKLKSMNGLVVTNEDYESVIKEIGED